MCRSLFYLQFLVTFKDGVITFDVTPTAVDSGKRHLFAFSRNGNEVIGVR